MQETVQDVFTDDPFLAEAIDTIKHLKALCSLSLLPENGAWPGSAAILTSLSPHACREAVQRFQKKGVEVSYNTDRPKYVQQELSVLERI